MRRAAAARTAKTRAAAANAAACAAATGCASTAARRPSWAFKRSGCRSCHGTRHALGARCVNKDGHAPRAPRCSLRRACRNAEPHSALRAVRVAAVDDAVAARREQLRGLACDGGAREMAVLVDDREAARGRETCREPGLARAGQADEHEQ